MKFRTLCVGVIGALSLVASGCAEGEDGANGAQGAPGAAGVKGEQGDPGDPGVTGTTGSDGAQGEVGDPGAVGADGPTGDDGIHGVDGVDGTNAACADTPALVSATVAGLDTRFFVGIESAPFTVTVMSADGTDVTATTELQMLGADFLFTPGASDGEYTVTPRAAGRDFNIVIIGADGCTTVLGDIVIDKVEVFSATVDIVHVFSGAPTTIDLALSGTSEVFGSVSYEDNLGFGNVNLATVTLDLLDPADGSLIATTPALTLSHEGVFTLVVHDVDGGGGVGFTLVEEDFSAVPADAFASLRIFHAAAGVGPVDLREAGALVFDDVAFGALSTETVELADANTVVFDVDVDQDALADFRWAILSADLFSGDQNTAFIYTDAASASVRVYMRQQWNNGSTADVVYQLSAALPPPDLEVDSATDLGLALDAATTTQTSTVTVGNGACSTLTNLTVDVDISHAYRGDIQVTLVAPSGNSYRIIDGAFLLGVDFIGEIADGAPDPFFDPVTRGSDSLSDVVAGESADAEGDWTIELVDTWASADDGTFNSWGLNLYCQ